MADQAGNVEARMSALEARVTRLEAAGAAQQAGAAAVNTHVVYHYGMPPCSAMPPCACGFASSSVQEEQQGNPTPADFSKLGQ